MPIVTRRQSNADFGSVEKPIAAPSSSSSSGRRATLAVNPLKQKDSNLLVDIAAPLTHIDSPFKTTRRRALAALSSKVAALAATTTVSVASSDKENQQVIEEDESDRAWEELNKPTQIPVTVVVEATPAKRGGMRRSSRAPNATSEAHTVTATATGHTEDLFTTQLNDVAPTPFKQNGALTPGPTRRRRSSTRGSALKVVDSTSVVDEDEFSFGSAIPDSFTDDDEQESLDRFSVAPHSLTPSGLGRKRSALTPKVRKSDRRSLHHTQLQLLKQLVQADEEQAELPEEEIAPALSEEPSVEPESLVDVSPVVVSVPKPTPAKVSRKSAAPSTAPRPSKAHPSKASRKSLFDAPLIFHGDTPPATPLTPAHKQKNQMVLEQQQQQQQQEEVAEEELLPVHARSITPRSKSRRQSLSQSLDVVDEPVESDALMFAEPPTVAEAASVTEEETLPVSIFEATTNEEIGLADEIASVADELPTAPIEAEPTMSENFAAEAAIPAIDVGVHAAPMLASTPLVTARASSRMNTPVQSLEVVAKIATPKSIVKSVRKSRKSTPAKEIEEEKTIDTIEKPIEVEVAATPDFEVDADAVSVSDSVSSGVSSIASSASLTDSATSSPAPPKKRSKRSLVRVVAHEYVKEGTSDIPDDILAQLFTRKSNKKEEEEEEEEVVATKEIEKVEARIIEKEEEGVVAKKESVADATSVAAETKVESDVEPKKDTAKEADGADVSFPSSSSSLPSLIATSVPSTSSTPARSTRRKSRSTTVGASIDVELLSFTTPVAPTRRGSNGDQLANIPDTPATPFIQPVVTQLNPAAMVERMRNPLELVAYATVFVAVLGVMAFYF